MTILDGFAEWLHKQGHGVYAPDRAYGDDEIGIVVGASPSSPDEVIVVATYQGQESDFKLGYDESHIQLRVRGTQDASRAFRRAQAIYDDWHGTGSVELPSGHQVLSVIGTQSGPIPIGRDDNGRFEHTINFRAEWRNTSNNRA
ncbi:hypothetical protein SAMN06265360_10621 [Haloechinothrix alba]|uniref:Tail terminator n=1 Tax=Haloechinothrix alba TaxID=664784 RepID=A0A238WBZ5_9PSEU|nr:minor capsid protein [Haloechinothrix alba]SNR44095.1 hypothetical protein SAMN06265360_10621 [Haloechinothrix alba]